MQLYIFVHSCDESKCVVYLLNLIGDRLVALVVKASASRGEDPGFESRLCQDFFFYQ